MFSTDRFTSCWLNDCGNNVFDNSIKDMCELFHGPTDSSMDPINTLNEVFDWKTYELSSEIMISAKHPRNREKMMKYSEK